MARPLAALLLLSLGVSTPSAAARLAWQSETALELLVPGLPRLVVPGAGVATVNGSGGGAHLTRVRLAGGSVETTFVPVTDPDVVAAGLLAVELSAGVESGSLGFVSDSFGAVALHPAVLPLRGQLRICLLDPACLDGGALALPLATSAGSAGLGIGGLLTVGGAGPLRLSLVASPWTVGAATVAWTTPSGSGQSTVASGWRHGALSFTTSTALSGGAFSLVTPLRVENSLGATLPGFARVTVRFLPEPTSACLLGAGAGLLLLLSRRSRLAR